MRDNYYSTKEEKIFDYSNWFAVGRSSQNNQGILKNNNLESVFYQSEDPVDFIKHWAPCKFLLNTDPSEGYGLISVQCTCLDTISIGGNGDCQKMLFPELTGIDTDTLSSKIDELISSEQLQEDTLMFAKETFKKYYSLDAARIAIEDIYNKLKK